MRGEIPCWTGPVKAPAAARGTNASRGTNSFRTGRKKVALVHLSRRSDLPVQPSCRPRPNSGTGTDGAMARATGHYAAERQPVTQDQSLRKQPPCHRSAATFVCELPSLTHRLNLAPAISPCAVSATVAATLERSFTGARMVSLVFSLRLPAGIRALRSEPPVRYPLSEETRGPGRKIITRPEKE